MTIQRDPVKKQILTRCQAPKRTVRVCGVRATVVGEFLNSTLYQPCFITPLGQARGQPVILTYHVGNVRGLGQARDRKRIKPAPAVQRLLQFTPDALRQYFARIRIHPVGDGLGWVFANQPSHLIAARLSQAQAFQFVPGARHEFVCPAFERPKRISHRCHLTLGQARALASSHHRLPFRWCKRLARLHYRTGDYRLVCLNRVGQMASSRSLRLIAHHCKGNPANHRREGGTEHDLFHFPVLFIFYSRPRGSRSKIKGRQSSCRPSVF